MKVHTLGIITIHRSAGRMERPGRGADQVKYMAMMSPASETPPNSEKATGMATLTLTGNKLQSTRSQ